MTKGYDQNFEGVWIRPAMKGFIHQCCSCCLVHKTDYRVVDGRVEFRVVVDKRKTAASRRKLKFTKEDE